MSRCAACKYLRKRCPADCIYSPYFPSNNPQRFENVHRIYGASNIARMLQKIPVHLREDAANTLHYEANCRVKDPVYGCVRTIYQLQQELISAQNQLAKTQTEIALVLNIYGLPEETFCEDDCYSSSFVNYNARANDDGVLSIDPSYVGHVLM